ncbi:MAG: tetratricopeptide repeat protein [Nannocystaceae bacterium]
MLDRLAMLRQMVARQPSDPFPRYGLGMELKKRGDHDDAWRVFSELIGEHPGYVAAYLMTGNLLETMGRTDEAREVYTQGMRVASAAGDDHTRSELETARSGLA